MLVSSYVSVYLSRKTNDAFLQVAQAWGHEQVKSPRLIFAVIEMESDPVLADVFELESFPSLVYLSESHDISKVCEEWCVLRRFLRRTDSLVLEGGGGFFSSEKIIRFLKQCTGIEVVEKTV